MMSLLAKMFASILMLANRIIQQFSLLLDNFFKSFTSNKYICAYLPRILVSLEHYLSATILDIIVE